MIFVSIKFLLEWFQTFYYSRSGLSYFVFLCNQSVKKHIRGRHTVLFHVMICLLNTKNLHVFHLGLAFKEQQSHISILMKSERRKFHRRNSSNLVKARCLVYVFINKASTAATHITLLVVLLMFIKYF